MPLRYIDVDIGCQCCNPSQMLEVLWKYWIFQLLGESELNMYVLLLTLYTLITKNSLYMTNFTLREQTNIPSQVHFWKWCPFFPCGICWFPGNHPPTLTMNASYRSSQATATAGEMTCDCEVALGGVFFAVNGIGWVWPTWWEDMLRFFLQYIGLSIHCHCHLSVGSSPTRESSSLSHLF